MRAACSAGRGCAHLGSGTWGAEARDPVRAWEFDAAAVRDLCAVDAALGLSLVTLIAETIGDRLRATRTRLLDLYGPSGPQRGGAAP
ncbi:hypothetical protein GCM10020254_06250 [Streptomyces goshikiensis]